MNLNEPLTDVRLKEGPCFECGFDPAEVKALADAMWQILDDMGKDGQCVCNAAKAKARIAFEPFNDEPDASPDYTLAQAQELMARLGEPVAQTSEASGSL